jgi:hypothetical protein
MQQAPFQPQDNRSNLNASASEYADYSLHGRPLACDMCAHEKWCNLSNRGEEIT